MTPESFVNEVNGRAYDEDGSYGSQCWDLFRHFLNEVAPNLSAQCSISGYVRDLWQLKDNYGYGSIFDYVQAGDPVQDGDWVVYGKCAHSPEGHIAFVYNGMIYGCNQNGHPECTAIPLYSDYIGAFRYRGYDHSTLDDIVDQVIHGDWGNGADRMNRLSAAGYDYNQIQGIVNQKLGASNAKSNEEIADEVIRGDWGNGEARVDALTAAGYDYNAIQEIVNERMG